MIKHTCLKGVTIKRGACAPFLMREGRLDMFGKNTAKQWKGLLQMGILQRPHALEMLWSLIDSYLRSSNIVRTIPVHWNNMAGRSVQQQNIN